MNRFCTPANFVVLFVIALTSCNRDNKPSAAQQLEEFRENLSPEERLFFDAYQRIQVGMSEQDVDALLGARRSRREEMVRTDDSKGNALPRPTSFCKWYDENQAREGKYCVIVYFDDQHVVLFKSWYQYSK